MSFKKGNKMMDLRGRCSVLMVLLCVFAGSLANAEPAVLGVSIQHFKMLSTVEYTGEGQFASQAETLFTVNKQTLAGDKVQYLISSNGPGLSQQQSAEELSFIVDRQNQHLLAAGGDLAFFSKINNGCVDSLKQTTRDNIGKTWTQSFDMSFLGKLFNGELKFTLTAIQLETKALGEMVAVRALSEPFAVNTIKKDGSMEAVQSKVGAVYLFDPEIEDIYISAFVFESNTKINGFKESLRHEVATYKTDFEGVASDFRGLGLKFERFVKKTGLTRKELKVTKKVALPRWARSEALRASQAANICAAMACEGAPNPVAMVFVPAAHTVGLQSIGGLATVGKLGTVTGFLAKSMPGIAAGNIAAAPLVMGMKLGTAGLVVGGTTAGAVAAGSGGGGGGGSRSPY